MASLKETPRQKMIGMMYLVLTALLALQVSDALLQKFTLLNNSLEIANQSATSKNKGVVQGIDERIKDLPNPAAYADVLKRANEVRRISDALVNHLDGIKSKVLETGVFHGLTTMWILKALEDNKKGKLISIDIKRSDWNKYFKNIKNKNE